MVSVFWQDVLYDSQTQASLYLSNLVEGTYLFQLRVTDAQGRTNAATATVEVRPGMMISDLTASLSHMFGVNFNVTIARETSASFLCSCKFE